MHKLDETSNSKEFHCRLFFRLVLKTMKMSKIKTAVTQLSLWFVSLAYTVEQEVQYFLTSNQNFPGPLASCPLVKGSEEPISFTQKIVMLYIIRYVQDFTLILLLIFQ